MDPFSCPIVYDLYLDGKYMTSEEYTCHKADDLIDVSMRVNQTVRRARGDGWTAKLNRTKTQEATDRTERNDHPPHPPSGNRTSAPSAPDM